MPAVTNRGHQGPHLYLLLLKFVQNLLEDNLVKLELVPLYILCKTSLNIKPHCLPWFYDRMYVTGTFHNMSDSKWLASGMSHLPKIFLVAV